MKVLVSLSLALAFVTVPVSHSIAQTAAVGAIHGIVRTAVDSSPVPAAIVALDSSGAEIATDSAGAFVFRAVPAGPHAIRVHRLGFAADTVHVAVRAGSTTTVILRLAAAPRRLAVVEVRGRKVLDLPRFTQAVERAARNNGAVFTADDIAQENPVRTRDLLQRLAGVDVNDRSITFARCEDTGTLPGPFGGTGGAQPKVQVYVDGMRLTGHGGGADEVGSILNSIPPSSIAVMEVYTGLARIPAEYAEDACAVIAIWTKEY